MHHRTFPRLFLSKGSSRAAALRKVGFSWLTLRARPIDFPTPSVNSFSLGCWSKRVHRHNCTRTFFFKVWYVAHACHCPVTAFGGDAQAMSSLCEGSTIAVTGLFFGKTGMEDKTNRKTRKVAGMDLNADCFLYAPDLANTASWLFPVLLRGDEDKTRNLIVMHLHNFDGRTAGLTCELRQELFNMLRGCAITHGLRAERRTFAAKSDAPTPAAAPPVPVRVKVAKQEPIDPETQAIYDDADAKATALLKRLGYQ
jgi:hypothetical protein